MRSQERSSTSTSAGDTWRLPARSWSSSVSSVCVNAGDVGEAEGRAATLDGMRHAENGVDELGVDVTGRELEQRGLHGVERFEALFEEGVVELREIERHAAPPGTNMDAPGLSSSAPTPRTRIASSSAGERACPYVVDVAFEAVEREGDDELHAGGVYLLDAAAVDLVGARMRGRFEQMRAQRLRLVDGAGRAEHHAADDGPGTRGGSRGVDSGSHGFDSLRNSALRLLFSADLLFELRRRASQRGARAWPCQAHVAVLWMRIHAGDGVGGPLSVARPLAATISSTLAPERAMPARGFVAAHLRMLAARRRTAAALPGRLGRPRQRRHQRGQRAVRSDNVWICASSSRCEPWTRSSCSACVAPHAQQRPGETGEGGEQQQWRARPANSSIWMSTVTPAPGFRAPAFTGHRERSSFRASRRPAGGVDWVSTLGGQRRQRRWRIGRRSPRVAIAAASVGASARRRPPGSR